MCREDHYYYCGLGFGSGGCVEWMDGWLDGWMDRLPRVPLAQVLCTILNKEAGNANFEVQVEKWEDDSSKV